MTITRRPQATAVKGQGGKPLPPANVEEIINRGGSVTGNGATAPVAKSERKAILIKLDGATLDQIEAAARARKVKTTRQTWIEEAVIEKLTRSNRD